jgi:hypothetical protein
MDQEMSDAPAATELESSVDEVAELLGGIDRDGALQETAAAALPQTRGGFLRQAAVAVVGGVGGLVAAGAAEAAPRNTANDRAILRFDLVLEYLQAGLYTEAERLGAVSPKTLEWARVVGAHERAHVAAIKGLLGRDAVPSPGFNYGRVTAEEQPFIRTAVAFEDLTGALLKYQAPRLDSRSLLAAVATLHTVETRHAAWIRRRVGLRPVNTAFDKPASQQKMARLIASTHFVASQQPKMARTRKRPRFTG